ncbi:MAG: hypothetical protein JWO00_2 [Candidatus Parcubacteria bacterium]|nr:hypothetical protein [Candidatus Parcubacteria bacterium]
MNPLRQNFIPLRMLCLLFIIWTAWNLAWSLGKYFPSTFVRDVFDLFMVYFISCTPRPWGKNLAGKWIDFLASAIFGKFMPQAT